jgi:hypothetical protein
MNKVLLAVAATALSCAATLASAGPPPGGGRYVGPYPGGAYRPFYPAVRPVYPGWGAGYWGPRAGIYFGGPAYWGGGWPYAWGATYATPYAVPYAYPYAVAPLVVNTTPVPQVIVQPAQQAPADSFWYYCTQPAGYFPYVQNCTQPWMKVVPQVPGSNNSPPQLAP